MLVSRYLSAFLFHAKCLYHKIPSTPTQFRTSEYYIICLLRCTPIHLKWYSLVVGNKRKEINIFLFRRDEDSSCLANVSILQVTFPQLKSLLKTLHLLVKKHKYQYLIMASLILAACYRYMYVVLVLLVQYN
jgi:hypothetical protein